MSIYDNETKIYPDLNSTPPQESQTYRLKKITEIEAYLLDEIEERRRQAKKKKRFNKIVGIVGTSLIASSVVIRENSIAALASGVGLHDGAVLGGIRAALFLPTIFTRKSSRPLTEKQAKHNSIKLLAQCKLDSITDIIS